MLINETKHQHHPLYLSLVLGDEPPTKGETVLAAATNLVQVACFLKLFTGLSR